LEDWYLFGDRLKTLNEKVLARFDKCQFDKNWLEETPYTVCSMDDF